MALTPDEMEEREHRAVRRVLELAKSLAELRVGTTAGHRRSQLHLVRAVAFESAQAEALMMEAAFRSDGASPPRATRTESEDTWLARLDESDGPDGGRSTHPRKCACTACCVGPGRAVPKGDESPAEQRKRCDCHDCWPHKVDCMCPDCCELRAVGQEPTPYPGRWPRLDASQPGGVERLPTDVHGRVVRD